MHRIVITNQHSDNRGDESAVIGMVSSLRKQFGDDSEITILLQTKGFKFLDEKFQVNEKSMLTRIIPFSGLTLWILFKKIGVDIRKVTGKIIREFIDLHDRADIVISSCGGPYIGDIYINHEILHIVHLYLALVLGKKTAFYAPSMGPFKNKLMNPLRRKLLKKVDVIVLRDSVSYEYVRNFIPDKKAVYLTTDSCLADRTPLMETSNQKNMIGITPLDYSYPLREDTQFYKQQYEKVIVQVLNSLMKDNTELRIQFFPQLYGKHTDVPFIKKIIAQLDFPERTIIFPDTKSGQEQQREISTMKYMIATRYHSAIFSAKMKVPVVTIYYEHKAKAFMKSIGLDRYCIDIYSINAIELLEKISSINENYEQIKKQLNEKIPELSAAADRTAEIVYQAFIGRL